jgi:hypothetical protein
MMVQIDKAERDRVTRFLREFFSPPLGGAATWHLILYAVFL